MPSIVLAYATGGSKEMHDKVALEEKRVHTWHYSFALIVLSKGRDPLLVNYSN